MRLTACVAAMSFAAILGCGSSDGGKNSKETGVQPKVDAEQANKAKWAKNVPKGVIMIAEIDAKGEVIGSKMRSVDQFVDGKSAKELIQLFSEKGTPIDKTIKSSDDLDSESSTASFFSYQQRAYYRCGIWKYCRFVPQCAYRGIAYTYVPAPVLAAPAVPAVPAMPAPLPVSNNNVTNITNINSNNSYVNSNNGYQVSGVIPAYSMPYSTFNEFRVGYTGYGPGAGASVGMGGAGAGVGGGAYVNPAGPAGGPGAGVGYVNPAGPAGGPGAGVGYEGMAGAGVNAGVGMGAEGPGYQSFYPAGSAYPNYGGYTGNTSTYQVYGWNRGGI